jgi:hypothetical protein
VSADYNTINFVRTIEEMLGLDPLNVNDSAAQSVADVFDADGYPHRSYEATPSALLYNTLRPVPPKSAGLADRETKTQRRFTGRA